ncbi:unnamed protein product, partial [Thlaspi arvense]
MLLAQIHSERLYYLQAAATMNDLQGQRDEMFMDKNVAACDLPEIVVCSNNYKELTYNVVNDKSVDEGVPMMMHEKFLFNEKVSVKVNANPLESKSSEDSKVEEFVGIQDSSKLNQENLIVKKSPPSDVGAASGTVSKEPLTLGDIISMEDSQKALDENNIHGPKENVDRETEQKKTEEPKADSLRYISSETAETEKNPLLKDVLEDSYDHSLLSNGLRERSFSDAESEWNSSPVRMVKAEKRPFRKEKGWRHYSLLLCCRF